MVSLKVTAWKRLLRYTWEISSAMRYMKSLVRSFLCSSKLIDACDTLSVQVHPGDELAAERHHAWGKTEMWYILEASDGAVIYTGFKEKDYKRRIPYASAIEDRK